MKKQASRKRHDENAPEPVIRHNITIRQAVPRDATPLYDLLVRYFDGLSLLYPGPVPGPTMAWGLSVLVKGGVFVAEESGELIGSVGLELGHFPWAPTVPYLNGVWFYVIAERRRGGTAAKLMQVAKDTARQNKCALRLDNVWGVEPERQDRYREINGFRYVGGNHVWFPGEAGA